MDKKSVPLKSNEQKQKISEAKIGKSFSDEHKQRISDSLRKYHQEGNE
jgi:hypothetical protein